MLLTGWREMLPLHRNVKSHKITSCVFHPRQCNINFNQAVPTAIERIAHFSYSSVLSRDPIGNLFQIWLPSQHKKCMSIAPTTIKGLKHLNNYWYISCCGNLHRYARSYLASLLYTLHMSNSGDILYHSKSTTKCSYVNCYEGSCDPCMSVCVCC